MSQPLLEEVDIVFEGTEDGALFQQAHVNFADDDNLHACGKKKGRAKLAKQHIGKLDVAGLTALTPEIISRQATMNIGTIGHVAHGKSTLVKAISGVKTMNSSQELERNMTIKLGYANAKIYKCDGPANQPGNYCSRGSGWDDEFVENGKLYKLVRHVSFVDCPGHDVYMATMLNGAAVMDAALLLIAGNQDCPQPQTAEHLAAIEIMKLENVLILQNKVDLVKPGNAEDNCNKIKKFVAGTVAEKAPIIPISGVRGYNIDVVCEYIARHLPVPVRNFTAPPRMMIVRSFDINKPGTDCHGLKGGVAGGSILQGVLKVGDEVEIRPGIITVDSNGGVKCQPIHSRIMSLFAEQNELQYAVPGGLIGVGTKIDPILTRKDRLIGQILGLRGQLPDVFTKVEVSYFLLKRLLGVRAAEGERPARVQKLMLDEILMVNIGSTSTGGTVVAVREELSDADEGGAAKLKLIVTIALKTPVCADLKEKIALSRRIEKSWRLIGWGEIEGGVRVDL